MVYKVGDTVKITSDCPEFYDYPMRGKYGTIERISSEGVMTLVHIRNSVDGEDIYPDGVKFHTALFAEPCSPMSEFSINDWNSIMEAITNG